MTKLDDIKALIHDTEQQMRQDRRARRCWGVFHDWEKWEPSPDLAMQFRTCLRCGLTGARRIGAVHMHRWKLIARGAISDRTGAQIGFFYTQRCIGCGQIVTKNEV
jgi:hypothetical protein